MDIKEVSVEVGETRNHPFEYGNRRASVRMTAGLDEGDNHEVSAAELRLMARQQVEAELDGWEKDLLQERHVEEVLEELGFVRKRFRYQGFFEADEIDNLLNQALTLIDELPEDRREPFEQEFRNLADEKLAELEPDEDEG